MAYIKKLHKLIDKAEVVSFDVFDTLILRQVLHPVDVFVAMEEQLNFDFDFKTVRMQAEPKAYGHNYGKGIIENSLDDIYEVIKEVTHFDDKKINEIKNLEITLEKKFCVQNEFIYEQAYKYALSEKKKIVFNSDMYLPFDVVKEILHKNGYDKYKKIYLSTKTQKPKWNGDAYKLLLNDFKIKPSKILHIGDNKYSDIKIPKKFGLKTFWYQKSFDVAMKSKDFKLIHNVFDGYEREEIQISSYLALIVNEFYSKRLFKGNEFFYFLGFSYVGIILLGFVKWIIENAKKDKVEKLFFLSRDGYILHKIYKLITKDDKTALPSEYMYASRRVFRIPGIEKLDEQILYSLTETWKKQPIKNYFERLNLDVNKYLHVLKQFGFKDSNVVVGWNDIEKIKGIFKLIEPDIIELAKKEREILYEYFNSIKIFDYKKIAMIDIGWAGTMQKAYQKNMLKLWNIKQDVEGYYLGLQNLHTILIRNKDFSNIKGYISHFGISRKLYDYLVSRSFIYFIDIWEFLLTAPHGSVLGFEKKGNKIIPIYDNIILDNVKKASNIHDGVLNFIQKYSVNIDNNLNINKITMPLQRLFNFPTYKEAKKLGDIPFVSAMGKSVHNLQYIAKIPKWYLCLNPIKVLKGFKYSPWKIGYIKQFFIPIWFAKYIFRKIKNHSQLINFLFSIFNKL